MRDRLARTAGRSLARGAGGAKGRRGGGRSQGYPDSSEPPSDVAAALAPLDHRWALAEPSRPAKVYEVYALYVLTTPHGLALGTRAPLPAARCGRAADR